MPIAHLRGASPTGRRVCNATRQGGLQPGYDRLESHLHYFVAAPRSLTMLLDFFLEFCPCVLIVIAVRFFKNR